MTIVVIILSVAMGLLLLKLYGMKKALREITQEYKKREQLNTNSVIGISSRDADVRALTKQLNKSLKQYREKYLLYTQGDEELRRTIINITHDLRTPLTAICGYVQLLQKKEVTTDQALEYLTIIENRADYMKDLTEELFEFSKTLGTEAKKNLVIKEVFVNQILEDTIMEYYGALTEAGIEPVVEITEEKIVKNLDSKACERIFSNLISNSLKYSLGDLKITLDENARVTFSNFAPNLSRVDVERLFDRYYTVETGKASTGLGLSIAKSLVGQMGGTIGASIKDSYLEIEICF